MPRSIIRSILQSEKDRVAAIALLRKPSFWGTKIEIQNSYSSDISGAVKDVYVFRTRQLVGEPFVRISNDHIGVGRTRSCSKYYEVRAPDTQAIFDSALRAAMLAKSDERTAKKNIKAIIRSISDSLELYKEGYQIN